MIRVIGIDPGRCTGVVDVRDGEIRLHETTWWGAYGYVIAIPAEDVDVVVVTERGGREAELLVEGLARCGYRVKTAVPGRDIGETTWGEYRNREAATA